MPLVASCIMHWPPRHRCSCIPFLLCLHRSLKSRPEVARQMAQEQEQTSIDAMQPIAANLQERAPSV